MKNWSRFLLLFVAYGIALLHTAVPHQHTKNGNGVATISHAGCLLTSSSDGLLQKILSTDLGVGHLETFKKASNAEIEFTPDIVPLIAIRTALVDMLSPSVSVLSKLSRPYIESLKRRLLLFSVSHFRAPPAH